MKALLILNDPPYGTERTYHGLRLAGALAKRGSDEVRVFLMGDAAATAKAGQRVPQGYYHLGRMVLVVVQNKGWVAVCGSCMDARGLGDADLVEGARRSNLEELADWTEWADKVVVF
ncbi:MAG: DsrE family protein [Gemmatimonadales bacterium]|nr:DsrE family protein [Gemmatimonadales bacterium]